MSTQTKAFHGYASACVPANDNLPEPRDVSGTLRLAALTIRWTAKAWENSIIPESIGYDYEVEGQSSIVADKVLAIVAAALKAADGWTIEDIIANQEVGP